MLLDFLQQWVRSHILLYSTILEVRSYIDTNLKKYLKLVELSKIDSIKEFDTFQNAIESAKNQNAVTLPRHMKYGGESIRHYGYYQAIMNYAGMDAEQFVYIPALEHGIRFREPSWAVDTDKLISSISYACEGPGRCSEIHSVDPWKPIFILGPYIHYTGGYYNETETKHIKDSWGKTLLVFPSHTWERKEFKSESDTIYNIVYNKYATDYDTILVCVYWNDVDSKLIDHFKKSGAKIVSAGFRGDYNFVRRLKTIIELSNDVVVDDLQTNIGFCKYMGRKVFLECTSPRFYNDPCFVENFQNFHEAFYTSNKEFTEKQFFLQNKLYRFFWGGDEFIKTSEEMADIIMILKEMCRATNYNIKKMPDFIYRNCPAHTAEQRYRLLADSVSQTVWKSL